jgi:hypothetical protein
LARAELPSQDVRTLNTHMPEDLQEYVRTNLRDYRAPLRKVRELPTELKPALYAAGVDLAGQLNADVQLYGLYEALLYVAEYENRGRYPEGTTRNAVHATLEMLTPPKALD